MLFISINTAMQVFKPHPIRSGHGGLYPYRYYVYATVILVPLLLSSLAFVNKSTGVAYLSQGPTCSLPIRPFWYRLALAWIPRYVIIIVVVALYIAIYVHAERQFTEYRPLRRRLSNALFVYPSSRWRWRKWLRIFGSSRPKPRRSPTGETKQAGITNEKGDAGLKPPPAAMRAPRSWLSHSRRESEFSDFDSTRNDSVRNGAGVAFAGPLHNTSARADEESRIDNSTLSGSTAVSRAAISSSSANISPTITATTTNPPSHSTHSEAQTADNNEDANSELDTRLAWREMKKKHRTIRRQLRLQFVYPIIYFISWLAPFASHATTYSSYFAQHPIFPLTIIAFISLALMGIVDFWVFSLRERPWRHIPGTDGSVLGSFVFWKVVERRRLSSSLRTDKSTPLGGSSQRNTNTDSEFDEDTTRSDGTTAPGTRRSSAAPGMVLGLANLRSHSAVGAGAGAAGGAPLGAQLSTIYSAGSDVNVNVNVNADAGTMGGGGGAGGGASVHGTGTTRRRTSASHDADRRRALRGLASWSFGGNGGSRGQRVQQQQQQVKGLGKEDKEQDIGIGI